MVTEIKLLGIWNNNDPFLNVKGKVLLRSMAMFTSYQQEQELVDWLLKANMVFLMQYSKHLRSLTKYCMKHIQTADQTPIASAEDAALQQCHTLSISIAHPGFHHIAQFQCCLHLKYFVAGHK